MNALDNERPSVAVAPSRTKPLEDARVMAALEEYLNALEAGQRPNRSRFLRRHAAIAELLAECLDSLEFVQSTAARLRQTVSRLPSAGAGSDDPSTGEPLGDFRIGREIGRGGMGVVYEAEQISLGRRVALKVLPFAATMDPRHLQRFHNEARAAANLDHPHIVKIYAVGCERGVHFYAMQFIDGQSLEVFLRRLRRDALDAATDDPDKTTDERSPQARSESDNSVTKVEKRTKAPTLPMPSEPAYFRRVAEWGVQAAEALEHAHSLGIVHRDIKPANLLIDNTGRLWIADFGLARRGKDAGLTLTGDVLGTLRYMSPEQALAKHGIVGYRTDVYSLGVSLYELLTLRPAVEGEDREEVLKKIALDEPPRPRQRNSALPREWETILLKAMEKNPGDRYGSAQELADDLRRFLADEPIRARRPSWTQRMRKWERRHRAAVLTGFISFVLLWIGVVAALLISNRRITQEKNRKDEALQQVEAQRQEAERRSRIAERNFQRAVVLLHNAPLKHQLEWARNQVPNARSHYRTQEKALALFRRFLTEPGADPGERLLAAEVHRELADIYRVLRREPEGVQEYRKAIALLRPLAAEFAQEAGFRDSLANCLKEKAALLARLRLKQAAQSDLPALEEFSKDYRQAIALYEDLRREFPDVPWYRVQIADCWNDLGGGYRMNGLFRQGERAKRRALAMHQTLLQEFPQSAELRDKIIAIHSELAWILAIRPDRNATDAAEAREHAQKAVNMDPGNHDYWHTLGVVHCRLGQWREALACSEKSRQLETQLLGYQPKPPDAFDRFFEAMAYHGLGDREKARRRYEEGVQWMRQHAPTHADLRRFRTEVAALLQAHPQDAADAKKAK